MYLRCVYPVILYVALAAQARADLTLVYTMMVKADVPTRPVTWTRYVRQDRILDLVGDKGTLYDVKAGTVTTWDPKHKTYTVQALSHSAKKTSATPDGSDEHASVKTDVRKNISGYDAVLWRSSRDKDGYHTDTETWIATVPGTSQVSDLLTRAGNVKDDMMIAGTGSGGDDLTVLSIARTGRMRKGNKPVRYEVEMTLQLVEYSTKGLDDAAFQVPADYVRKGK